MVKLCYFLDFSPLPPYVIPSADAALFWDIVTPLVDSEPEESISDPFLLDLKLFLAKACYIS